MDQTISQIATGLCDDGEMPYVPGVNCVDCGKFVGRDGCIEIAHREMSGAVASVEGTCGACMMKASAAERRLSTCQRCQTLISDDETDVPHRTSSPCRILAGARVCLASAGRG